MSTLCVSNVPVITAISGKSENKLYNESDNKEKYSAINKTEQNYIVEIVSRN